MTIKHTRRSRTPWIVGFGIVASAALIQLGIGRVPWCKCGYVKLWHGVVMNSENSQHLTDWYTPSHIIHGFAFYLMLWPVARRFSPGARFVTALFVEALWEVVENTPLIINRYREVTISLDYYGDSVVNSVSDILAMVLGYWLAGRLPVWLSIALVVGMELGVGLAIRDGLILNIIMLLWPNDAIRQWQAGG